MSICIFKKISGVIPPLNKGKGKDEFGKKNGGWELGQVYGGKGIDERKEKLRKEGK
jgi:hypothetical protein